MNVQNVSIVLSPTLQISHRVLNAFFTHGSDLFRGVILKKYVFLCIYIVRIAMILCGDVTFTNLLDMRCL